MELIILSANVAYQLKGIAEFELFTFKNNYGALNPTKQFTRV